MDGSTRRLDLVGIGECMVELSADRPLGEADSLAVGYGGDVLNALVMASRLGMRTGFVSRVGDDAFGPSLLRKWRAAGIDTGCSPLVPGSNGVYFISSLPGDEHEFWYYRAHSAASTLSPADVPADYVGGARAVLLSGITQAISASAQAAALAAARQAHAAGALVFYDPNYRPRLWATRARELGLPPEHGSELARQALTEIAPFVDCVLPSHPSDAGVFGRHAGSFSADDHLAAYEELGCNWIGLKVGNLGSRIRRAGEEWHAPAVQGVTVRDSTGAGDAWNAAFICTVLQERSMLEAARTGNQVASWKIQHRGAIPGDHVPLPLDPATRV